jgi:hypothetical protein
MTAERVFVSGAREQAKGSARVAGARQRLAALNAQVAQQRDAAVAAADADRPQAWPVALVPRHRARVRRTAARRQAAFVARLRALIAFVRTHDAGDDERTLEHPAPLGVTATRVVVATCSACRGKCCGNGGDHAFLRTSTIREFIAAHPSLDDGGVIAAYVDHLPARAMHPGCVYQGTRGCTLPRDMRSAICNAYLCVGLQNAVDASVEGQTRGVFVAHREGEVVTRGQLRALPVLDMA